MPDPTTTATSSNQFEGQVSLPNDGQILSTDTPDVSAPSTPATSQPQPVQQSNTATIPNPMAQPPAQGVQPQQPAAANATIPQKPPVKYPQNNLPTTPANHPSIQKAGLIKDIAQTLAGGPKISYQVDENGNMKATKVPLSNRQILTAIALEALSGAATGLATPAGPNAAGRAAGAAFVQSEQRQQQAKQEQQQMATADYSRRMQTTETNMRMLSLAKNLGTQDFDTNQEYLKSWSPLLDFYRTKNADAILANSVPYSQFNKYNATLQNAIPEQLIKRLDAQGNQVKDANGVPQWDMLYTIVDPSKVKAAGQLSPDIISWGKQYGLQGMDNPNIDDSPMSGMMAANKYAQVVQLHVQDQASQHFFDTVHGYNTKFTGLKNPSDGIDDNVETLAQTAAKKYDVPLELVNGILKQEHGGIDNVSPAGAVGPMQLMPATAKALGVTDINDPAQNVDGGVRYFATLLHNEKGDVKAALGDYNAGPNGNKDNSETKNYISSISKMIGLDNAKQEPSSTQEAPSFADAVRKDGALRQSMESFNAYLGQASGAPNQWGRAIAKMSAQDPTGAARVLSFYNYNGQDNINKFDRNVHLTATQSTIDQQLAAANQKSQNTHEEQQRFTDEQFGFHNKDGALLNTNDIEVTDDMKKMSLKDLENYYANKGITVPPLFAAAYNVAHYKQSIRDAFPTRVWAGSIGEADAQRAIDAMAQTINPDYTESKYASFANFRKKLDDPTAKQAGGMIQSASVAAAHIDQLQQLAKAMDEANNHNNLQPLNALANRYNIAIGNTPAQSYQAVATAVGQEVAKAVSGDKPAEDVVDDYIKSLNNKNALKQTQDVAKQYSNLMYSRVYNLNEQAEDKLGETLAQHGVGAEATRQWQQYGWDTPWAKNSEPPTQPNAAAPLWQGQRQGENPIVQNNQVIGYQLPDGKGWRKVTPFARPTQPAQ